MQRFFLPAFAAKLPDKDKMKDTMRSSALIFTLTILPILITASFANSFLGSSYGFDRSYGTSPFSHYDCDSIHDSANAITVLAAVIGFAGASCIGLLPKKRKGFDTRIIKALGLFPVFPGVIYAITQIVMGGF